MIDADFIGQIQIMSLQGLADGRKDFKCDGLTCKKKEMHLTERISQKGSS